MPIVPASEPESDELEYGAIRPIVQDRDTDNIKEQLQKIETDRLAALKRKSIMPPAVERFTHPTFDDDHGCWKIQSLKDPRTLKIWDEKKGEWRERFDKSSMYTLRCGNVLPDFKADWRRAHLY